MSRIATARKLAGDILIWTDQITRAGNACLIDNNLRDARSLADAINHGYVNGVTDEGVARLTKLRHALFLLRGKPLAEGATLKRTSYAFKIEACNEAGTIWQTMASEICASERTPNDFASMIEHNQNVVTGNHWRVRVWSSEADRDAGVPALATAGPRG